MLDAGAQPRVVQHVDDGAVNVGYGDLGCAAPDALGPEYHAGTDMPQREACAMVLLIAGTHGPLCHHYDIAEELLRQIPVLRRSAAADVGRVVQCWHEHPWVVENLFTEQGVEADRCVGARTDTPQPALSTPPGQQLRGGGTADVKRPLGIGNLHDIASRPNHCGQPAAPLGYGGLWAHGEYIIPTIIPIY